VPELGVPRGDAPVAHLATPQWQSFEIRMRARKADRCLQRAAAALDDGSVDEANDALEEARQLSPLDPRLQELSARLNALKHPAPPPSTVQNHGSVWTSAAIVAGLVVVSAAGWETWTHRDTLALLFPKAHPDMDVSSGLAAPTAVDSTTTGAGQPNAASATTDIARSSGGTDAASASSDTVVQTTLVRPDQVIDTRVTPEAPQMASDTSSVPTIGSGQLADTKVEIAKPVATTSTPEPAVHAQLDTAPSLPSSPEYRPPVALPAPQPNPSAATNSIPSVVPPTEPPRPLHATTTASGTNGPTDRSATPPAATAPAPTSTAAASAPPAESSPAPDDRVAIRAALSRYESAYNRLDVDAVRTIWPTLDQRALARAFDSLNSQRVALQNCNVDVSGSTAKANCSGNASWTPKIGGGERSADRRWTFDLSESNGAWRITQVRAR
jgi:hypothetical protein